MTGNCPNCRAIGEPGKACPACGRHIPTHAEIARTRLVQLLAIDAPFQVVILPDLGRCLVETFLDD